MTAAHFRSSILCFHIFLFSIGLNSCELISCNTPKDFLPDIEKNYQEIIYSENNYEKMNELWGINKKLQIGESPQELLKDKIDTINRMLNSSRNMPIQCKKSSYMKLAKKYGLSHSLLMTGIFTSSELERVSVNNKYDCTKLFNDEILNHKRDNLLSID